MNYRLVASVLGKVMLIEAVLMLFPLLVGVFYGESTYADYLIPMAALFAAGVPLSLVKPKDGAIYAKDGFVIVALCWIVMSLAGALPFVIGGEIPNFADAFFETVSGFTTTGASILNDVEFMSRSAMFWRVFTHWLGGMGVLVFVLAVLPASGTGAMHIFRAESPGPSASKLVGKMRHTAQILYGIYFVLTLIETVMLLCGGLNFYESLLNAFSTAGTGGFSIHNGSIAFYDSVYVEMVIAVFMFLFGINFNLFYLILIGHFSKAIRNREFLCYLLMVVFSTLFIALNILSLYEKSFAEALRFSFFQVTSISSTTGFATADFDAWPALSKGILLMLMAVGACGGSTGGGIKVSRVMILCKTGAADVKRMINPRAVVTVKYEGGVLTADTERNVRSYFVLYVLLVLVVTLIISLDPCGSDIFSNLSATVACAGNVGPGFGFVGPMTSYAGYSWLSKTVLSFTMLAGRLEIFPLIILFTPRTWRR